MVGAVLGATWGFFAFPMMNSANYVVITAAVTLGLDDPRVRCTRRSRRSWRRCSRPGCGYSGVSLGYQVTSIVAGSLAPIIAVKLLDDLRLVGADRHLPRRGLRHHARCGVVHPRDQRASTCKSLDVADAEDVGGRARGRGADDRLWQGAPPWSPVVASGIGAACARARGPRCDASTVADVDERRGQRRSPTKSAGSAWAVDLLDVATLAGFGAGDRRPGQQRGRADGRPDHRVRPSPLPVDARADGRGAVPADPRGACRTCSRKGSAGSSTCLVGARPSGLRVQGGLRDGQARVWRGSPG